MNSSRDSDGRRMSSKEKHVHFAPNKSVKFGLDPEEIE